MDGLTGQTLHFPISGNSTNDFSSSFGPRNIGSANYPNSGYDYDFHGGVDIGNATTSTNVYPMFNGVVVDKDNIGAVTWITLSKSSEPGVYFKYHHLHNITVDKNDVVVGGTTILGQIEDDHLDIRYLDKTGSLNPNYLDNLDWGVHDYNTRSPSYVLVTSNTASPTFVDSDGNAFSYLYLVEDNGTSHNNQQGKYIEFGVRVLDDELDLTNVNIQLTWEDDNGNTYDAVDLLLLSTCNDYSELPFMVDYDFKINCGDITGTDSDVGHNCGSVGIYPRGFSRTDNYHTVYFRWYINESFWDENNISVYDVYADIYALDAAYNFANQNNIGIYTCMDCSPPDEAPLAPTLQSVTYQATGKVYLTWQPASGGESADFYRIYRCLSSETMTDYDVIGITTATNYLDDNSDLISNYSYKYAVAGVNWAGEGYNSNELSITLPCFTKNINNKIYMGYTNEKGCHLSIHDVEIKSGASVIFDADESIEINGEFEVDIGAEFELK